MAQYPGPSAPIDAPIVRIAPWRAKLARTRCAKSGSAGTKSAERVSLTGWPSAPFAAGLIRPRGRPGAPIGTRLRGMSSGAAAGGPAARGRRFSHYVYVNVNFVPGVAPTLGVPARRPRRRLLETAPALALHPLDLGQRRVDVFLLLQQPRAPLGEDHQELRKLRALVSRHFVEIEQLADLRERQPKAFAPQDQLEANPFALAVDARAAPALRREQPAVLVEADRPCRQREFLRQRGNRVHAYETTAVG